MDDDGSTDGRIRAQNGEWLSLLVLARRAVDYSAPCAPLNPFVSPPLQSDRTSLLRHRPPAALHLATLAAIVGRYQGQGLTNGVEDDDTVGYMLEMERFFYWIGAYLGFAAHFSFALFTPARPRSIGRSPSHGPADSSAIDPCFRRSPAFRRGKRSVFFIVFFPRPQRGKLTMFLSFARSGALRTE